MNMLPGPAQAAAIGLSIALPLLLLGYARIAATGGSGRRFRLGCVTIMALYAIACVALPGPRHVNDVLGGLLLLATAMMFVYVLFSLLAWGFTLTLLTALVKAGRPLTLEQWAVAYMQGGDLGTFTHNRLKLLVGAGMVITAEGKLAPTTKGVAVARLVKFVRLSTGLG